jgi:hypothetical protein
VSGQSKSCPPIWCTPASPSASRSAPPTRCIARHAAVSQREAPAGTRAAALIGTRRPSPSDHRPKQRSGPPHGPRATTGHSARDTRCIKRISHQKASSCSERDVVHGEPREELRLPSPNSAGTLVVGAQMFRRNCPGLCPAGPDPAPAASGTRPPRRRAHSPAVCQAAQGRRHGKLLRHTQARR